MSFLEIKGSFLMTSYVKNLLFKFLMKEIKLFSDCFSNDLISIVIDLNLMVSMTHVISRLNSA